MADEVLVKNFKEFYQKIKPYLNGQVPTIANKFDKANLYSTDEKIVGRWIDGKPLYQKAYDFTPNSASGVIDSSLTKSVITPIMMNCVAKPNANTGGENYLPLGYAGKVNLLVTSGGFEYSFDTYVAIRVLAVIQYTKTTDSTIEIGSDTDYSTTEKVIGTWIDGSPIYQITVPVSGDYTATGTWMTLFAAPTGASGIINGNIFLGSGVTYPTLAIIGGYVKLNCTWQIGGMLNCTIQYIKAAS